MTYDRLSERERRVVEALPLDDQKGYRNLRETGISHRNALDLLEKWRREDAVGQTTTEAAEEDDDGRIY